MRHRQSARVQVKGISLPWHARSREQTRQVVEMLLVISFFAIAQQFIRRIESA
jgi:hypothetical protein